MKRLSGLWPLLAILIITFIVFSPSLLNSFVDWDDPVLLLENKPVQQFNVQEFFTTEFSGKYYPLTLLSFAIEFSLFKFMPFVYHFTNLLLHLVNILLLYQFLLYLKFSPRVVFVAALLFAIHPLQVESVAWVSSRKDLLAMCFALLTLQDYVKGKYSRAIVFFILSLFSKPLALTMPVLLWLLDRYRNQVSVKRYIPFFAVAAVFGLLTLYMADKASAFPATQLYAFGERFLFSVYALILYLFKLMLPVQLSCYYPLPEKIGFYPPEVYQAFFPAALLAGLFLFKNKEYQLAAGWFLIAIFPTLHLIKINDSLIYERFVYFPSIGVFLGLALISERVFSYRKVFKFTALSLFAVWMVFLAMTSWSRCFVWRNSLTLWNDVVEKVGFSPLGYLNRGQAYYQFGKTDLALRDFNHLVRLKPDFSLAYFNRANIYADLKDYGRAIKEYDKAIYYDPQNVKAYNNRGNLFSSLGENEAAIRDYSKMLELDPGNLFALLNRGIVYNKEGKSSEALADFEKVLMIDPQNKFAAKMIVDIKKN